MKHSAVSCWIVAILVACLPWPGVSSEQAPTLRVATFRCDVTPAANGRFIGGWAQPLTKPASRLERPGDRLGSRAA